MAAMEGFFLWTCLILVLGTIHWRMTGGDVKAVLRHLKSYVAQLESCKDSDSIRRLDESMNQLREKNYVLACRFLRQANFATLLTATAMHDHRSSDTVSHVMLFVFSFAYMSHTCVAEGVVKLSTASIRRLFCFLYVLMLLTVWHAPFRCSTVEKIRIVYQVVCIVCYVDSAVHIPFQFALSLLLGMRIEHRLALGDRRLCVAV